MVMTSSLPSRAVVCVVLALAMLVAGAPAGPPPARAATPVFVNELHYDNDGTDADEFVEIAAPAGTNLSGWSVVLYNGSSTQRSAYSTTALSGTVTDAGDGFGFTVVDYPSNGIQNGAPDGVALLNGTSVVQFLSYEGTFTAGSGPAAGLESADIGVEETGRTPAGSSLQLGADGTTYGDFAWQLPQPATPGAANAGQAFGGASVDAPIVLACDDVVLVEGESGQASIRARDADETVTSIAVTAVDPPGEGITIEDVTPAPGPGQTATATLAIADTVTAETYGVTVEATNDEGDTATCEVTVTVLGIVPIGTVQGEITDADDEASSHESQFDGQQVVVQGVVYQRTLTDSGQRGFFLQNTAATDDGNPLTSDGIFVFTSRFGDLIGGYTPRAGDEVVVTGFVDEFFSLTQLTSARLVDHVDSGVDVAPFTVNPPDDLDAAHRYWERREGMRAQVPAGSVVQGGRDVFGGDDGELWAIPGDHPVAEREEPHTNRVFRDPHPLDNNPEPLFDDGNGYRFAMGSFGLKFTTGDTDTLIAPGRTFDVITNAPTGGVYFSFGKYVVEIEEQLELSPGANPADNAPPVEPDRTIEYSVATANVENLYDFRDDPFDGCDFDGNDGCPGVDPPFDYVPASQAAYEELLDGLATQIVVDLHAPDIVAVQEAEDQDICTVENAALACGDVDDADGRPDTLQELALTIADAYGVAYDAAYDRDGADDRGIVAAHLYRSDRVALLPADADDPVLGSSPEVDYEAPALDYNDDVQNPKALNAELPDAVVDASEANDAEFFELDGEHVFTRDPQVAKFRVWRTEIGASAYTDVWVVSNHFSSGPDARVLQRTEQAAYNAAIVAAIEEADPDADIVVAGDFNVFPRPDDPYGPDNPFGDGPTDQLAPLYDQGLENLWDEVLADAPASAYSYVFEGQAQTLDSMFVNDNLAARFVEARFAHINADWPAEYDGDAARGVSDHDPLVARFMIVASVQDLADRVGDMVDAGALDERRADILMRRLERTSRFFDRGQTDAACSQLQAFGEQVAGWTPRFVDADTAAVLSDSAAALSLVSCG